jgi:hypothetical protein
MNNIKPAVNPQISNEVRISSSENKSFANIKDENITAVAREAFQSQENDWKDIEVSLVDLDVKIGPPENEDEDFSFFDDMLSGVDEIESQTTISLDSVLETRSEATDITKEFIPILEKEQENEARENSAFVKAFTNHESVKIVEKILDKEMVSLKASEANLDVMMGNPKVALDNTTVDVRFQGVTVTKFVKDATPEELKKAKAEDFGMVVGDRHFRHPRSQFKAGDTVTLMVNGQQVQFRVEIMRDDQVAKFEKLQKEYVDLRNGNLPVLGKADDQKHVEQNKISEGLKPKDLRHEIKKDKPEISRTSGISIAKSDLDKNAALDAARVKDAQDADNKADEIKKKAIDKEIHKGEIKHQDQIKESIEDDTVTLMQTAVHVPDKKDQTIRLKTATKTTRKAQE